MAKSRTGAAGQEHDPPLTPEYVRGQLRRSRRFRKIITIWIIIFTLIVVVGIRQNRSNLSQLKKSKASLTALQSTNCSLKGFLIRARNTRATAAAHDKNAAERENDINAALGYEALIAPFTDKSLGDHCRIPKPVPIPGKAPRARS